MTVIKTKKPNSLCKNINCRKAFYACAYCTHKLAWRAVACSPECYSAYINQVTAARAANKEVNLLPERTDMTPAEVKELITAPTDDVLKATKEELGDYAEDLDTLGLGGTIDKINNEIDESHGVHVEQVDHIPLSDPDKSGNKRGGQRKDKK